MPTAEDGRAALREHLRQRALEARARHAALTEVGADLGAVERLLADPEVVRFPTRLVFGAEGLLPGEFAWPRPRGEQPSDGFDLLVHPHFRDRPHVVALLVAYQIPAINYLDVVTHEEAELFGATFHDLEVDDYYDRLCTLVDGMPHVEGRRPPSGVTPMSFPGAPVAPGGAAEAEDAAGAPVTATEAPAPASAGCGPSCGCAAPAPGADTAAMEPLAEFASPAEPGVVSALVVVLAEDAELPLVTEALGTRAGVEVGELQADRRLPVAVEAADAAGCEEATRWLGRLPGVAHVEVVAVGLPADAAAEPAP